ncbi:hypothetical protein ACLOJK_025784 [Asimina triloba]
MVGSAMAAGRATALIRNFAAKFVQNLKTTSASLPQTQKAHSFLLKIGLSSHTRLATKLISLYAHHSRFDDASFLLDSLPDADAFSFSTLISACSKSGLFAQSIRFFCRMLFLGIPPDSFIFPSALKACAGLSIIKTGCQVHGLACTSGFNSDCFVQSSLVHMYIKCGEMRYARRVFDGMKEQSVVSWSAMVAGYAQERLVEEAMTLFNRMQESGVQPNVVSWNGLISGFSQNDCSAESLAVFKKMHLQGFKPDGTSISSILPSVGNLEALAAGVQIHGYVIKHGLGSDACVVSALVDTYGRCRCTADMLQVFNDIVEIDVGSCNALVTGLSRNGHINDALRAFRDFERQGIMLNVVSWTSMVASCAQNGKDIEALELFREMQLVGVKPNSVTIPCLLPACANIAALMHGKAIHGFSIRKVILDDVHVGSALMDMYAKCGRIADARCVFDRMPSRNVVSWNAIIGGYAMHGDSKEAMNLFSLMERSGPKPDFISFTCVLSACSQTGLTEEGWYYFKRMSGEYGITARKEHYACMVNLLSRAGRLEEAYGMIKEMPSEPDACVWGALLSSSRVHGNVSLAEKAAQNLFQLEPRNSGNYVLLSNVYAAKGMWDRVDRVRDTMKLIGLKKSPGCSWIEVKNKVHMLLAGDQSHPQMTQILERLNRLNMEMKKLGYLPNTNCVLQDVEEQEKEHILYVHSEKLAIGLGLLNTPPHSPLRVIKNLRICGDCHVAIKFISSFEQREIFVRDTNRFHHFKNGVCSCGDYW